MKNLSIILMGVVMFTSCKSKDKSLETDKNIVILTDTSKAANSYLSDTGVANMPVAAALAPAVVAPTTRNTTTKRTSSTSGSSSNNNTSNNSGAGTSNNSTAGTSSNTRTTNKKTGWSQAAKGATIGGVGGAVAGAIISKKKGKGAIIGGVVGATGGYIIGRGQDRKSGRVGN